MRRRIAGSVSAFVALVTLTAAGWVAQSTLSGTQDANASAIAGVTPISATALLDGTRDITLGWAPATLPGASGPLTYDVTDRYGDPICEPGTATTCAATPDPTRWYVQWGNQAGGRESGLDPVMATPIRDVARTSDGSHAVAVEADGSGLLFVGTSAPCRTAYAADSSAIAGRHIKQVVVAYGCNVAFVLLDDGAVVAFGNPSYLAMTNFGRLTGVECDRLVFSSSRGVCLTTVGGVVQWGTSTGGTETNASRLAGKVCVDVALANRANLCLTDTGQIIQWGNTATETGYAAETTGRTFSSIAATGSDIFIGIEVTGQVRQWGVAPTHNAFTGFTAATEGRRFDEVVGNGIRMAGITQDREVVGWGDNMATVVAPLAGKRVVEFASGGVSDWVAVLESGAIESTMTVNAARLSGKSVLEVGATSAYSAHAIVVTPPVVTVTARWFGWSLSATQALNLPVDGVPPSTRLDFGTTPPNPAGWLNAESTLTLTATDLGGVGVRNLLFGIDGPATTTANPDGELIALPEGTHTLRYFASDRYGNSERVRVWTLHRDATPPVVTVNPGLLTGTVSDSLSGVGSVNVLLMRDGTECWDGAVWIAGDACRIAATVSSGSWSVTGPPLTPGSSYATTAFALDVADNAAEASASLTP